MDKREFSGHEILSGQAPQDMPLTIKGRLFLKLGFHRGLLGILPPKMITVLINLRAWIVQKIVLPLRAAPKPGKSTPNVTPGLEQDEAAG